MASPNSTFNQVLSTTLYKYADGGKLADNVFHASKLLDWLRENGAVETVDGGNSFVFPIAYANNSTFQAMTEWQELDFTNTQKFSAAEYGWKVYGGVALCSDLEVAQNMGASQIQNLVKAKIENLAETAGNAINLDLYDDPSDSAKIVGLDGIIKTTDPSLASLGGIARSSNAFWKGNVFALNSQLTVSGMVNMYLTCTQGTNQQTDLIITDRIGYERYEALGHGTVSYNTPNSKNVQKAIDLGMPCSMFRGIPVIWDVDANSGRMYFVNSKFLKVFTHKNHNFKALPAQRLEKQKGWKYEISWLGNVCCNAPRFQGVLTGLV